MRAGLLALLMCVLAAASPAEAETVASPLSPRALAALQRADSLIRGRRHDQGLAVLDSLIAASPGPSGAPVRMRALATKGGSLAFLGQGARAEEPLRVALPLARSLGDSALFAETARWLAFVWLNAGRLREADSLYESALPIAVASGARRAAAYMQLGRAYVLMQNGRPRAAIPRYRAVGSEFRAIGDAFGELEAVVGLGRSHQAMGRFDSAAVCYRLAAIRARAAGQLVSEGNALNNLGTIEYLRGDPQSALRTFRDALATYQRSGHATASLVAARNIAMALSDLGRIEEAAAQLDSLEAEARRAGEGLRVNEVRLARAQMYEDRDAAVAALSAYRSLAASSPPPAANMALESHVGIARSLFRMDRDAEALAVLDSIPQPMVNAASPLTRQEYLYARGRARVRLGRNRDGLDLAMSAARIAETEGRWTSASTGRGLAAVAASRLGSHALASEQLDRAVECWERARRRTRGLEWRDPSDQLGVSLVHAIGETMLADARVPRAERIGRAWERLQRVKSRALLDRLSGNAPTDTVAMPGLSMIRLRSELLGPGELLLDVYVGSDSTFVFGVSTSSVRLTTLPGWRWVRDRATAFASLLQAPSREEESGAAFVQSAARQTGRSLIGAHASAIRSARRILVSPDGPLAGLPFEALACPGEASWLAQRHEIAYVPSMTLVAIARGRHSTAPPERAPRLLVLAGSRNGAGEPLAGAVREARFLAEHFEGATLRVDPGGRSAEDSRPELVGFDALHVAAHAEVDVEHPWRSGLLLKPRRSQSEDGWWRAEQIAGQDVPERLVVLSGCSTAGGRARFGGGVEGLTAAFLNAGASAVVSTLWPVDDRVAAALMEVFYTRLSEGRSVAAALREGRLALARRRATSHPRDWAAFVLTGDGGVRLPLESRPGGFPWPRPRDVR